MLRENDPQEMIIIYIGNIMTRFKTHVYQAYKS